MLPVTTPKQWQFRSPKHTEDIPYIARKLDISTFLADILLRRGFTDIQAMDEFLAPKLARLTNPQNWPEIPRAAEILADKLLQKKKIIIWGDYDVDGITATTLCLDVLEHHGISAGYHLPHRHHEGYGLNIAKLEELHAQGYEILLTVDCGISNRKAVERAKELGMTVVISDHHLAPEKLPAADAICNPRIMPPESTPCQELAGVGVAFYLMAQVNKLLAQGLGHAPFRMDLVLDLVALGTLADLMPLTGENRILVSGGLKHIALARRKGLAALKLMAHVNVSQEMKSTEISFRLVPRLNASGRMRHAETALKLLRSHDSQQAMQLAQELDSLNTTRRSEEEKILQEARQQAIKALETYSSSLVLYGSNWHPGVIGIVASRIVEEFGRPTFILCDAGDHLKGSGRTLGDLDLHGMLSEISSCLISFGGHRAAAALNVRRENLEILRQQFDASASRHLALHPQHQSLLLEGEINLSQAFCAETLGEIALLEPFGQKNPEPIFATPPLLVERHDYLGYDQKNILLTVWDASAGIRMQAKGWRMGAAFPPPLLEGKIVQLAFVLRLNMFRGIATPELEIKDIHLIKRSA
ncbi:MAG: single-stranded-DNA-specific exonuclease RecJ [Desulfovibrio sp.]|nr:single-stranded-DNA-specific exonuclease RecJ [Desulfovibrio sp.]